MKSIIRKYTKETKCGEVTQLYVFGVPVFRSVYVGAEDKSRRQCGFIAYESEAPFEVEEDEDEYEDDDDEQYIILPYGKDK